MNRLRIAIQKSGRLTEASKALLEECGINLPVAKRKLMTPASNFPLEVYYLRDDDIPAYVADGIADLGILGENVFRESQQKIDKIENLRFAGCRLSVAIPKNVKNADLQWLSGKRIATTYPNVLQEYLDKNAIKAEIHKISGSVEIAPNIGLADAICDIVSSGSTLLSNGLKELCTVFKSQAILVGRSDIAPEKKALLDQLLFRIRSVQKAQDNQYILLNAPNNAIEQICNLIPGMKSPTIVPLVQEGWSSIQSVIDKEQFWEVIDQLKQCGAQGILTMPIGKMIL